MSNPENVDTGSDSQSSEAQRLRTPVAPTKKPRAERNETRNWRTIILLAVIVVVAAAMFAPVLMGKVSLSGGVPTTGTTTPVSTSTPVPAP